MAKKPKEKSQKSELLIKKSLVQDYIKSKSDYKISPEIFEILSDLIKDLCEEAIERARLNGRKTIQKQDI